MYNNIYKNQAITQTYQCIDLKDGNARTASGHMRAEIL